MSGKHGRGSSECREMFARLSEYLDQDLDPSLCRAMDSHFEDCPPCEKFLDALRATVKIIGQAEPRSLPDDLKREIVESYRRLRDTAGRHAPPETA